MQETEYRNYIKQVVDKIESTFEKIDPDMAECENSGGALTLRFSDGSRCILSAQPSVRQLWLAVASKGMAFHFNFETTKEQWLDDKGQGIELLSYLKQHILEKVKDLTPGDLW